MSSCGQPRLPVPGVGETTSSTLPPNVFAGKELPYTASSVVPVVYGTGPYYSSQYTDALQQGNMYFSMSTMAGPKNVTFASNEDRIKYLKGKLFIDPSC